MKNDLKFTTALAAALLASGCGNNRDDTDGWTARDNTAVCTDRAGNRTNDDQCRRGGGSSGAHWLFLARNGVIPPYGERVRGGSALRAAGASYRTAPATTRVTRAGAISRGGFGASAHSFGGARS